jgi:tetratricopeptide (TPR) repeat protein
VTHALELDPMLAEAHTALAYIKALFDWDWSGSESEFRTALEPNENCVMAHQWYAHLLAMLGRFSESMAQTELALGLDPLSLIAGSQKGWMLYFAHRFGEAAELLYRTLDMDATFGLGVYFLGLTYLQMNRPGDAIRKFTEAQQISADHPGVLAGFGQAYALQHRAADAHRYLELLEQLGERRYVTPYFRACIHVALGDNGRELSLLATAFESRCPWMSYLNVDPAVDGLRQEARFQQLVAAVFATPVR